MRVDPADLDKTTTKARALSPVKIRYPGFASALPASITGLKRGRTRQLSGRTAVRTPSRGLCFPCKQGDVPVTPQAYVTNHLPLCGRFRIQQYMRRTAKKHHQPQKLLAGLELSNGFRCSGWPYQTKFKQDSGQGLRISGVPAGIICMQQQRRHWIFPGREGLALAIRLWNRKYPS